MEKLFNSLVKKRKRLLRDIKVAQVLHPEMRPYLEGFSVELLIMDSKINKALEGSSEDYFLEPDQFATI
eukprot:CAMPEP_0185569496 /NCGR_PEP_ID=MMETSP0434-20130131/2093_1 /TAXON_ID=626734 ORGANISM="Favella taraikaensis, Strain Fe Narragansett Bay" /NCGR_SAMPLE_ID=MMETSP0434 /ASSEMBLY_ACC=CAM_ASM_000379 /LENGTH=68 /DNA_ID=CAMNT_0028184287 /DNA_START=477 /DNA_END=683 /DNA_ORIENTATION=-